MVLVSGLEDSCLCSTVAVYNECFCIWYLEQVSLLCLNLAMAGNIVPAIASTNAVVGGIIVMEALHIISSNLNQCKSVRN